MPRTTKKQPIVTRATRQISRHAPAMLQYAKDAQGDAEPWLRWEMKINKVGKDWMGCTNHPLWEETVDYRRVTMMGEINGVRFPLGEQFAPEDGTKVYFPIFADGTTEPDYDYHNWDVDEKEVCEYLLRHRLAYLDSEGALKRAEAMVGFTEVRAND